MFLGTYVFPLLVTKNQMCLTGSITSKNKGGGSDPLRKKSIVNPLFFCDGFPNIYVYMYSHVMWRLCNVKYVMLLSSLHWAQSWAKLYFKKIYRPREAGGKIQGRRERSMEGRTEVTRGHFYCFEISTHTLEVLEWRHNEKGIKKSYKVFNGWLLNWL